MSITKHREFDYKKIINEDLYKYLSVLMLLGIYFVSIDKIFIAILLNSISSISTIIGFIYANFIKTGYVEKTKPKRLKYIDFKLYMLVIINFLSLIVIFYTIDYKYYYILYCFQALLEYSQLKKMYSYKGNYVDKCVNAILYMSIISACILLMINNQNYDINVYAIAILFTVIYVESSIKKRNKMISKYLLSIALNYYTYFFINCNCEFITYVIISVKGIMFVQFYKYTIDLIFDESIDIMTENINKARKRKRNLNSVLKKRNVVLSETNMIIDKKQDKYKELLEVTYGGVFMFVDNKLKYFNKVEENLNVYEEKIQGIEFENFLMKYFNMDYNYLSKCNNYISTIKMNHNNLDVEVFLTITDENTKILYIQDKTQLNESLQAKKELEEYLVEDEVKQEFFARISHDFKTPINNIFTAIQLNDINIEEENYASCDYNRKIVKENCLKLIKIINNFIDFNKISEGFITPNIQTYNIVEIMQLIVESCNKYICAVNSKLTFTTDSDSVFIRCDNDMINRIVLNIIANYIKQANCNVIIDINISTEIEDMVKINIKSNGRKVDEKIIPCIFDEHTKINKLYDTLKESGELGLFLVKALIELQNGEIIVDLDSENYGFEILFKREECLSNYNVELSSVDEKVEMEFSDIFYK